MVKESSERLFIWSGPVTHKPVETSRASEILTWVTSLLGSRYLCSQKWDVKRVIVENTGQGMKTLKTWQLFKLVSLIPWFWNGILVVVKSRDLKEGTRKRILPGVLVTSKRDAKFWSNRRTANKVNISG